MNPIRVYSTVLFAALLFLNACSPPPSTKIAPSGDQSLVLALAVLDENEDGSPKLLPGRLGILTPKKGKWSHRTLEDSANNVFHKAMVYDSETLLSLSGNSAEVKLWRADGKRERLWSADFGGQFSRMRDAEIGDIYGDGKTAIAVATHDQGVISILRPDDAGGFSVIELDRQPDTVVHEIELGDLDGDGVMEVYATPTAPNKVDGTAQPGSVARYVPSLDEGRTEVADLGDRHAKEILVTDIDDDGRDELYVSVEAVSGGKVEIRRYAADTYPTEGIIVATLDDQLCRFLTVGDVDGDGTKEMVAATNKNGLWLLRPQSDRWAKELIDASSTGFEHASILLDLDKDGRDELYVASDDQNEVRRYDWSADGWKHEVILKYEDELNRFTWNIMAVPTALLPSVGTTITDNDSDTTVITTPEVEEEDEKKIAVPRGLITNTDAATPGYVLYSPGGGLSYLVNKEGAVVHSWESELKPNAMYLLPNGNLLRGGLEPDPPVFKGGGQGGRIQEFSWEGELLWDWKYANEEHLLHHDIEPLPNGNVLAIAWESKSAQETNQAGRRPDLIPKAGIWPTEVIEIEPQRPNGGRIVWEWHSWDHLVQDVDEEKSGYGIPSEHPELIDINGDHKELKVDAEELARLQAIGYVPDDAKQDDLRSDVFHVNAIDYNVELDQIVLSSNVRKEIWIIDHSTTTEEAKSHTGGRWGKGGDLLYRWGNPATYGRGSEELPKASNQHDIQWISEGYPGAGHLLKFVNNLQGDDRRHSAIYEFIPPTNDDGSYVIPSTGPIGPTEPIWKHEAPDKNSFHSSYISGAQRLLNGNTFICSGAKGRFMEVTPEGEIVWEFWDPYSNPEKEESNNEYSVFRAAKLSADHPGLQGRELQAIDPQPQTAVERKAQQEISKSEPRGLILNTDRVAPGYNLFAPFASDTTYLTDQEGKVVHTWKSEYEPGCSFYLLDNGNLLRCAKGPDPLFNAGGEGGRIQMFSWDGKLLWDWTHATEEYWLHHDIEPLSNGNILAIAWETKTAQEANAAGRRPDLIPEDGMWPDKIIEIEPQFPNGANIVWEWHSWDHLVQDFDPEKDNYGDPAKHPELLNVNGDGKPIEIDAEELARLKALGYVPDDAAEEDIRSDMFHSNAIAYNEELNQIAISSYHLSEIFIIDHSTSTEEAASHSGGRWGKGGDLLYRWGNPKNYNRGTEADQKSFHQHDVTWIATDSPGAGNLLFYNNSVKGPDGDHSAVYELEVPTNADGSYTIPNEGAIGPAEPVWKYEAPVQSSFHSSFISGARRLLNGNTLIAEGDDGRFFEVTQQGEIVWEFREPFSGEFVEGTKGPGGVFPFNTFRVSRIAPDSPALRGRDLKPLDPQPETLAEREGKENPVARGLRIHTKEVAPGYVAYNPLLSDTTYLINELGQVVHTWKSAYTPSGSVYLLEDGHLLRGARNPNLGGFKGGGQGGRIEKIAQDGTVVWDWEYANEQHLLHHDIEPLPNGNVLAIAWEGKTPQEATSVGRRPDLIPQGGLWPDHIIEVEPQGLNGGRIVWEWHAWDHLVQHTDKDLPNYGNPSQYPERIDINANQAAIDIDPEELARLKAIGYVPDDADAEELKSDLLHSNAIDYNADLDQIAISVPYFNEVWIIDHSTTTAEAAGSAGGRAGKGGDLLYRWGNPKSHSQGTEDDQKLFFQHNIQWIGKDLPGEGNLLVFNNALEGPEGGYSAIYQWAPPTEPDGSYSPPTNGAFGPSQPNWKYEAPDKVSFSSPFISGVQRLPNGNTLICSGASGRIFEVTSAGKIVWEFYDPFSGSVVMPDGSQPQPVGESIHAVFRATKISPNHPGISGLQLQALDPQPSFANAQVSE
jgi:hypothetical protein